MWVHPACVPLTDADFVEYGKSEDYFLCPRCVSTSEDDIGLFDISKCLRRYVLITLPKKQSSVCHRWRIRSLRIFFVLII